MSDVSTSDLARTSKQTANDLIDRLALRAKDSAEELVEALAATGKQLLVTGVDTATEIAKTTAASLIDRGAAIFLSATTRAQEATKALADRDPERATAALTGSAHS